MSQLSVSPSTDRGRLDDGLPLAALILALCALVFAPLGILAALLGLAGAARSTGGKGLALASVVIGLLAGAVNAAAGWYLLMPIVDRSRLAEREIHDMANMRQIGIAMMAYAKENKGQYPEKGADWGKRLVSLGLLLEPALQSPRAAPGQDSYYFLPGPPHAGDHKRVIVFENPDLWRINGNLRGGAVLFDDGHCEWITGNIYEGMARELELQRRAQ